MALSLKSRREGPKVYLLRYELYPEGLAFNSAGNLFVGTEGGLIYEFTPGGVKSTFASGLSNLDQMAFQGIALPVPEPSALGLLAVGTTALLVRRRRNPPVD